MNRRRVQVLKRFMNSKRVREYERKGQFQMGKWFDEDGGKVARDGTLVEVGCDTAACMAGWAATIPSFRRDGLRLLRRWKAGSTELGTHVPAYKWWTGDEAIAKFLDIPIEHAGTIVSPYNKAGISIGYKEAVRRLDRLLKAGKPE